MAETKLDAILGLVFTGGTALAGLILVFLGATLASFDSYDAVAQSAVRGKYKKRARIAYVGFVGSLVAAVLALLGTWQPSAWTLFGSVGTLGFSFLMVLWPATTAILDMD